MSHGAALKGVPKGFPSLNFDGETICDCTRRPICGYCQGRNRLGLGALAVLAGSVPVFLISFTFTKPLTNLVSGVRGLEKGDYTYQLINRGGDEAAELTAAFDRRRASLQRTQLELIAAERLATIGRTASSISHDLRQPLSAVVANAESYAKTTSIVTNAKNSIVRSVRPWTR